MALTPPSPRALAGFVERGRLARRVRPPASEIVRPAPGQESVWDFPRPPRVEPVNEIVRVDFGGVTIARSASALRVAIICRPETANSPRFERRSIGPSASGRGLLTHTTSRRARKSFVRARGRTPNRLPISAWVTIGSPATLRFTRRRWTVAISETNASYRSRAAITAAG